MKKYKASKFILSSFFTIPYALFDNPYYSNVSNEAKLLYGLVIDRISLSIKNKEDWVDENNEVYCYYTNEAMQKILNRSKPFVIKLKKELYQAGLLLEVQQGMNKPNRIYPLEVKTVNPGSKQNLPPEVKTVNPNHTNINHTNINHTEIGISASAVGGLNTLFSKGNQDNIATPTTPSKLGEFNNLILENFGKQPSPLQIDEMRYLVEEHDLEVLKLAIKECVDNGKPYFAYMNTILNNWKHQGLVTAELVRNRVKLRSRTGAVTMLDDGYDEKLGI
mgnify:FL=1|jgi:DnaD/phage-associated family protein